MRVETKQGCRPLTISLPSIALQRINKVDGLLTAFCRRARTIFGKSEDRTRVMHTE